MHCKSLSRIVRTAIVSFTFVAAMSAGAQMVNVTQPYSGTISNPCNGDTINFSGTIHFHETTRISPDGRQHQISKHSFNVSGIGSPSGASYSISGIVATNAKFPSFPITFRQRTKVISSGPADNFHGTFSFQINGNGIQTTTRLEADCR